MLVDLCRRNTRSLCRLRKNWYTKTGKTPGESLGTSKHSAWHKLCKSTLMLLAAKTQSHGTLEVLSAALKKHILSGQQRGGVKRCSNTECLPLQSKNDRTVCLFKLAHTRRVSAPVLRTKRGRLAFQAIEAGTAASVLPPAGNRIYPLPRSSGVPFSRLAVGQPSGRDRSNQPVPSAVCRLCGKRLSRAVSLPQRLWEPACTARTLDANDRD